jgi:hypothetical protein
MTQFKEAINDRSRPLVLVQSCYSSNGAHSHFQGAQVGQPITTKLLDFQAASMLNELPVNNLDRVEISPIVVLIAVPIAYIEVSHHPRLT